MAPRAAATTPKKRGRPAKNAVASLPPAPVAEPKKRGRAAKVDVPAPEAEPEQPKKRGRAAKAAQVDAPAQIDEPQTKRRGRPPKAAAAPVEDAAVTPQKSGRGRAARGLKAAPKPPVASGVIGSPRVAKRTSPRRRVAASAPPPPPRLKARMRSRLRTRVPPKKAAASVASPLPVRKKGKLGRPRKDTTAPAATTGAVKSGRVEKPVAQPATRRHRAANGMATLEVPKKLLPQIKKYIQDLQEAQAQAEEGARQQALEDKAAEDAEEVENNDNEEAMEDVQREDAEDNNSGEVIEEQSSSEEDDEEIGVDVVDVVDGAQEVELQEAALTGDVTRVLEVTQEEAGIFSNSAPTELPIEVEKTVQLESQERVEENGAGASGALNALASVHTSPDVEFTFDDFQETATEAHNVQIAAGM